MKKGRKKAPGRCPDCGAALMSVRRRKNPGMVAKFACGTKQTTGKGYMKVAPSKRCLAARVIMLEALLVEVPGLCERALARIRGLNASIRRLRGRLRTARSQLDLCRPMLGP